MDFKSKYLKYKKKYLNLKKTNGGAWGEIFFDQCIEGDCENGYGKVIGGKYANYESYEGEFKNGKPHGKGTFILRDAPYNNDEYKGEFKILKLGFATSVSTEGQGTLNMSNGDKYEGAFKNNNIHGQGTLIYKNGDKYTGEFKRGKRSGQGTLIYKNGDKYEGEFKSNKIHGKGKMTNSDGSVYEGEWKNGLKV